MNICWSNIQKQRRCKEKAIPFSRYCWRHQDASLLVPTIVITIAITAGATWFTIAYQQREPELIARCEITKNHPWELGCVVENFGRDEARDVTVSFNRHLLLNTEVEAQPEFGVKLVESGLPPDPDVHPAVAAFERAFVIEIPRVTPKDPVSFIVRTANVDNQRAGVQVVRMEVATKGLLETFRDYLTTNHSKDSELLQIDLAMQAQVKEDNFFDPGMIAYEKGRQEVILLTPEEARASAGMDQLYALHWERFRSARKLPVMRAPVVRIKTAKGYGIAAIVSRYLGMELTSTGVLEGGQTVELPILSVPDSYD